MRAHWEGDLHFLCIENDQAEGVYLNGGSSGVKLPNSAERKRPA